MLVVDPASWSSPLDLELQEAPKEEMSKLIFLLWDHLHATTEKLRGMYV
jgi:hypothetical protein